MTKLTPTKSRLIETDAFPFEFLSTLALRESWRKEIHRPIYHVHKWWAKRLGSIFRGILLGCEIPVDASLKDEFYKVHSANDQVVFDPFMGSGTTVGEAHKLGFAALGRDINPVAVEAVKTALGPMDRQSILRTSEELFVGVGERIRGLYRSRDSRGRPCDVLYYFWVMQAVCPDCRQQTDLFPSYVIARHAYPNRRPEVRIFCPACGVIFRGVSADDAATCPECGHIFVPTRGLAKGAKATCHRCHMTFTIVDAMTRVGSRPSFRLYAKLVLTVDGEKEYLSATARDHDEYEKCAALLHDEIAGRAIQLPDLALESGNNTRQAMSYRFTRWRDFFNDRQLLALGWLKNAIAQIEDESVRGPLMTLFSGVLEFNNMFASYKGEGTGAVRHMFAHHILKPERTPIEAHVWGTSKSSGSFSGLLRSRLLRAIEYRRGPLEINGSSGAGRVCSLPFSGRVEDCWPSTGEYVSRGIYLSCGDSAATGLRGKSIDLIVTDPPFFDNVHYSELADFFHAWRQGEGQRGGSTRNQAEVQDSDAARFARKLRGVFRECHRVLRDEGLLVFTYHHSRDEGWAALGDAILGARFTVVNSQPVKAEMSVGVPKSQAKEPVQFDVILVCRKRRKENVAEQFDPTEAISSARAKVHRLQRAGFVLSENDRKIVLYGQLLTALSSTSDIPRLTVCVEAELRRPMQDGLQQRGQSTQLVLFGEN